MKRAIIAPFAAALIILLNGSILGSAKTDQVFEPTYHLVRTPIRRIRAADTIHIDPGQTVKEWLPVALVPPELDRQKNTSLHMLINGEEAQLLHDDSPLHRPYLIADVWCVFR